MVDYTQFILQSDLFVTLDILAHVYWYGYVFQIYILRSRVAAA
jgi:hypothetical protein